MTSLDTFYGFKFCVNFIEKLNPIFVGVVVFVVVFVLFCQN